MYHELDGNIDTTTGELTSDPPLKYCSQGNNAAATLVDCQPAGDYIPLNQDGSSKTTPANGNTNTAQMAWQYARNQQNFQENFKNAFLKLMTVPASTETLTDVPYQWKCVNNEPKCIGDLFDRNCEGLALPANCPAAP